MSKLIQSGEFALYEITGPLLNGLSSTPNKKKEKIYDIIKIVDNFIKGI